MLFKRRHKQPFWDRLLTMLWPRRGIKRSASYIWHRVARLDGSTHAIAAGFASGAAISFTPFLGLHIVLGMLLAWVTRGHILASLIGTFVGNPWSFPLIYGLTGGVGALMLGVPEFGTLPTFSFTELWGDPLNYGGEYLELLSIVAKPFIVGGMLVGTIVWLTLYSTLRATLDKYRNARDARRAARALEREMYGETRPWPEVKDE